MLKGTALEAGRDTSGKREGGFTPRHALQFQEGFQRWRGTFWIMSQVLLIVAVCGLGRSVNRLLLPWEEWPHDDIYALLQARARMRHHTSVALAASWPPHEPPRAARTP